MISEQVEGGMGGGAVAHRRQGHEKEKPEGNEEMEAGRGMGELSVDEEEKAG